MDRVFTSMRGSKSMRDLQEDHREFPSGAQNYELLEKCGRGVSATVWRALCKPLNEQVAVKLLDLESMNCRMEEVIREAQAMRLLHHQNVLSLHTAFVEGQNLWFVEPYVAGGSVLNILKFRYPEGLDEQVIAVIMKEVAKALEYVHKGGGIHRDVKAGNILIGLDGSVKLADFGVAATIERGGSWGNDKLNRSTFVGTPCWMAPEVMEQEEGYGSKADIWSFGITLLELAHGHAPFAKYPPMKVLMMTLQNPPPQLEMAAGQRHFSKYLRDLVANCLQKDPSKRPSATQILESKLFKNLPDPHRFLKSHILEGLPSLTERVRQLSEGKAGSRGEDNQENMMKAKEEYIKGMSGWNFDLAAIKAEVAASSAEQSPVRDQNATASTLSPRQSSEHTEASAALPPSTSGAPSESHTERPISPESVTSPTGRKTAAHSLLGTTTANRPVDRNGSKRLSRFKVMEETSDKPVAPASVKSDDGQADDDVDGKTVGRFTVEKEKVAKEKKVIPKTVSAGELNKSASAIPAATALVSHLEEALEKVIDQQSLLQETVQALKEADKGQPALLQKFLATRHHSNPDKHDRISELEKRVEELESENKALRKRIGLLEHDLAASAMSNGPNRQQVDDH